jgi:hypothetical protein
MRSCKLWTRWIGKNGYGLVNDAEGNLTTVHKRAWVQAHGPVPQGLELMHSCNNKNCYELEHLSLGTRRDNVQAALRDGLLPTGEQCSWSKLTRNQVLAIRERLANGEQGKLLAAEFTISQAMISKIKNMRAWRQ